MNELRVSGYLFDGIEALSLELKANTTTFDSWHYPPKEAEINFVTSAWNLVKSLSSTSTVVNGTFQPRYRSSNEILKAFIYTLGGNQSAQDCHRGDASDEAVNTGTAWLEKFIPDFPVLTSGLRKAWHMLKPGWDHCSPGLIFQYLLLKTCISRRLFLTSSGFMGIGPPWMREGDRIAVAFGLIMPVVLRPSQADANTYILIGPCYVQGIMDGEVVTAFESKPVSVFTLT